MRPARPASILQRLLGLLVIGALLGGCASAPRGGGDGGTHPRAIPADRDGPLPNPPADLASLPDAEPRIEPVRPGGANKPYQVYGHDYVPFTRDATFKERGLASWYGRKFHGKRTASGEVYDMYAMTAAHPTLPIPSYARIRNPANGREVLVRINDRGPFHADRIVDLSYAAALKLDLLRGVAPVELERITFDEIRAGSWRRESAPGVDATRVAAAKTSRPPATEASVAPPPRAAAVEVVAPPPAPAVPMPMPMPTPMPMPAPELAVVAAFPAELPAPTGRGFWVQLGAFRERSGAESFQGRVAGDVDWLAPRLATFADTALFRVQAGPYASRDEAQSAAGRIREAIGLVPMIVERR